MQLEALEMPVAVRCLGRADQGVAGVDLELDHVRTRGDGQVGHAYRSVEIALVIAADLRNQQGSMAPTPRHCVLNVGQPG